MESTLLQINDPYSFRAILLKHRINHPCFKMLQKLPVVHKAKAKCLDMSSEGFYDCSPPGTRPHPTPSSSVFTGHRCLCAGNSLPSTAPQLTTTPRQLTTTPLSTWFDCDHFSMEEKLILHLRISLAPNLDS